jgi:type II secretory pathway component PulJ
MSGADVIQVIASVAELARISYSLYQFFRRVRRANATAKESCQKIKELHRVVHGVELALRRRKEQVSREKVAQGEDIVWGHIRSSTRRCHKILLKIRREFTAFDVETDPGIIESAIRQIRFDIRKDILIECYVELDTNLQALQINTQTLNM